MEKRSQQAIRKGKIAILAIKVSHHPPTFLFIPQK